jgi:uncharacterized protein (DUF1778 family)
MSEDRPLGLLHARTTPCRITIYVPYQLDERIRRAAERAGQSLSVWMLRAAQAALREQRAEVMDRLENEE